LDHLTYLNLTLAPAGFESDKAANEVKIEPIDSSRKLAEQPQQAWFGNSALGSCTALFAGNDMSLHH
jgi:hypothetical protein